MLRRNHVTPLTKFFTDYFFCWPNIFTDYFFTDWQFLTIFWIIFYLEFLVFSLLTEFRTVLHKILFLLVPIFTTFGQFCCFMKWKWKPKCFEFELKDLYVALSKEFELNQVTKGKDSQFFFFFNFLTFNNMSLI